MKVDLKRDQRTRVKICGITRVEDASAAVQAGADAIGLVFCPASPRFLEIEKAAEIVTSLPPFVSSVALFVDAGEAEIESVLSSVRIDILQFHGEESPRQCTLYDKPYIKAMKLSQNRIGRALLESYDSAAAILLDTHVPGLAGGSGKAFDWSLVPENSEIPLILAGGLNTSNVARAIEMTRPYAVDVSSGVEQSPGIKSRSKMFSFVEEVNRVQR